MKYISTKTNKFVNSFEYKKKKSQKPLECDRISVRSYAKSVSLIDSWTALTIVAFKNRQHEVRRWWSNSLRVNISSVICHKPEYYIFKKFETFK